MPGDEKFWNKLREGGQRASFESGNVLYERKGKGSERLTYLDRTNDVRPLMSGRLKMADGLRAVGNLYGDSVLVAMLGIGHQFAQEAVDGGKHGATGGMPVRMLEAAEVARIAQGVMADMPSITHRCNVKFSHGSHKPITCRSLADSVCAHGMSLSEVALRAGWWTCEKRVPRVNKAKTTKLSDKLAEILKAIDEEWSANGIDARGILGVLEVR